ncbi:hypothetical protein RD1_A0107 (plasmid) [Roseobacter denitrificans OCh 114]|uniref:Uncharacterized protein n=1 Tax=Roseobacter denitrificans (strain ATCC 33942 / OCh 114) TaxID=375451 RepID=Q07GJ6_ROSDO|nr:hypothetical protein RD1_A0107 [Roseobacter denitrificans OCh 114]
MIIGGRAGSSDSGWTKPAQIGLALFARKPLVRHSVQNVETGVDL